MTDRDLRDDDRDDGLDALRREVAARAAYDTAPDPGRRRLPVNDPAHRERLAALRARTDRWPHALERFDPGALPHLTEREAAATFVRSRTEYLTVRGVDPADARLRALDDPGVRRALRAR